MNWARIFFGSVVVAVGVLLLLDNVGVLDAGDAISTYWPVLLIVAGLLALLANPHFALDVTLGSPECAYIYERAGADVSIEDSCPTDSFEA